MSFSLDVTKFAETAGKRIVTTKRGVALRLFGAIIRDTPVLTGRLRANWQTTLRSPAVGTRGVGDTSDFDQRELARAAQQAAQEELSATVAQAKGDDSIWLTNNLPYAARIEYDGWSHTKAPDGMVRKNFVRVARLLEQAIAEAKQKHR